LARENASISFIFGDIFELAEWLLYFLNILGVEDRR